MIAATFDGWHSSKGVGICYRSHLYFHPQTVLSNFQSSLSKYKMIIKINFRKSTSISLIFYLARNQWQNQKYDYCFTLHFTRVEISVYNNNDQKTKLFARLVSSFRFTSIYTHRNWEVWERTAFEFVKTWKYVINMVISQKNSQIFRTIYCIMMYSFFNETVTFQILDRLWNLIFHNRRKVS